MTIKVNEKIHEKSGLLVRTDGSVYIPPFDKVGGHVDGYWTYGCKSKTTGYRVVKHNKKVYSVHRLVAETFISNPESKPTVDHLNRVRDDNRVENLRWASWKEQNDNTSAVDKSFALYGVRFCENPKEYVSAYHKAYRKRRKAEGFTCKKCPDGKRHWVKEDSLSTAA